MPKSSKMTRTPCRRTSTMFFSICSFCRRLSCWLSVTSMISSLRRNSCRSTISMHFPANPGSLNVRRAKLQEMKKSSTPARPSSSRKAQVSSSP